MAKALIDSLITDDYEIEATFTGKDLQGRHYVPLFNFVETNENSHQILAGDFVTTEDGTGIVHMAPAYGDDDYKTCLAHQIPIDIIVQTDGTFNENAGEFAGYYIKDADPEIVTNLKHRGLLFKSQKLEHSYPHCWRHGTPLFYYATSSWFIRTTDFKEQMIKNNKTINWYPPEVGEGRFGNWLENNVDWSLSRNRYWGTPLNIWQTEDELHLKSISSIEELKSEIKKSVAKGFMSSEIKEIDLHKPQMDNIILVCDETGEKMYRTPEVIDCWFDSGSMPLAQWHYPFASEDGIKNGDLFPADFICEGIDQTRGWFYTLLAISTMLFDKAPYKNVIVNNLILDKDGQKMSKSKGNTVEPMSVMKKYGADTLRWFFVTSSQPWVSKRFDEEAISEVQRKFIGTLLNTYSFFALYANVDGFSANEKTIDYKDRPEIDRWILSLMYSTIESVNNSLDAYDITTAARTINDFLLNDVSNWYVRRNRRRFWKSELNADKLAAYQTLYEVLITTIKIVSPIMPFLSDYLYRHLTSEFESVHHDHFPVLSGEQQQHIDSELIKKMALIQKIVELARSLRSENQIKIRQPLAKMLVFVESEAEQKAISEFGEVIKDELNIKDIEIAHDVSEIASRKARPNFKHFGPLFGAIGKQIADQIKELSISEISELEAGSKKVIKINGQAISIDMNFFDIIHEKKEGTIVQTTEDITVALDIILTDELVKEGIAREFVNRLQNLRKDNNLELTDRIKVDVSAGSKIKDAIKAQLNYIKNETLSEIITFSETSQSNQVTVEGEDVFIHIEKT